jgi:hypothetical protein
VGEEPAFSSEFDDEFEVGRESANRAFFGRDVLRGLTGGIDEFVEDDDRWRRPRSLGAALLGSAIWIDDDELIERLEHLSAACIIVTKQGRKPRKVEQLQHLQRTNERLPGLPLKAFPDLGGLAPKVEGQPLIAGPYTPIDDAVLPTIRTLGYRKIKRNVPIVHAKLGLLGHLWWHDEGPLGHVEDILGFTPCRLWVSSANFTQSSRQSLEFGYWTEEPELLEGAERFLLKLVRSSEDLNTKADSIDPDLAPVEFDDEAIAEVLAELEFDDGDDVK